LLHPDRVAIMRIPGTNRVVYSVNDIDGGRTRRLLAEEIFVLRDRSDDGVVGRSRLHRARETFGTSIATERFAASTYKNGAALSGILSHPHQIGIEAQENLRKSFEKTYGGSGNAGRIGILEEGLTWTAISVSPQDAELLASRKFSVEQIARIFRVPPVVIGASESGAAFASVKELGAWFYRHSIAPWLAKLERAVEHQLLSGEARRRFEAEFDVDLLLRADQLTRFQSFRIGREVGLYSANDLRAFEKLPPRTDPDADSFLTPANMQSEQTAGPAPKNQ